jgi:hypothetical protein
MTNVHVECKRIARDLSQAIWQVRGSSLIVNALQKHRLIACRTEDQVLIEFLTSLGMLNSGYKPCLIHWISDDALSYFAAPAHFCMLYVARPLRGINFSQLLLKELGSRHLAFEHNSDVSLIYLYYNI